jgi:hypothetical protein
VLIIGIQKNVVGLVTLFYQESVDTSRTRIVLQLCRVDAILGVLALINVILDSHKSHEQAQ